MADPTETNSDSNSNKLLLGWFVVALLVRSTLVFAMSSGLEADPDGYKSIAANLRNAGVFGRTVSSSGEIIPTAHRPPIYPFLLSIISSHVVAIGILHASAGAATVALTWIVGNRLFGPALAHTAALLVLTDPILIQQSSLAMTETIAALLAVTLLLQLIRLHEKSTVGRAVLLGFLFGLAVLCRPTFAVWLGLLALVSCCKALSLWRRLSSSAEPDVWCSIRTMGITFGIVALTICPWVIRNRVTMGKAIPFTTHGGYTLLLGNNPDFYQHLRAGDRSMAWQADQLRFKRQPANDIASELSADSDNYASAFDTIRDDPTGFLLASWYRLRRLWGILPERTDRTESDMRWLLRSAVAVWYFAVLMLALFGFMRMLRNRCMPAGLMLVLPCLAFTLVHIFYWSNMRMRAPVMPFVCLLAAYSVLPYVSGISIIRRPKN